VLHHIIHDIEISNMFLTSLRIGDDSYDLISDPENGQL
jgi:hypothetical protein